MIKKNKLLLEWIKIKIVKWTAKNRLKMDCKNKMIKMNYKTTIQTLLNSIEIMKTKFPP